jgi:hypothetical protein
MLDVPCWTFLAGRSLLDVPCWTFLAGRSLLDVPCWTFLAGRSLLDVPCWMFLVGCSLLDVPCSSLLVGCSMQNQSTLPSKGEARPLRRRDGVLRSGDFPEDMAIAPTTWYQAQIPEYPPAGNPAPHKAPPAY